MSTWKVEFFEKPKLKDPILIEGLPGIGNIGKLAVDFIIDDHTAVEVKAKENVSVQDLKSLRALAEEKKLKRYLCVSLEARTRKLEGITVLPVKDFLKSLWEGEYA